MNVPDPNANQLAAANPAQSVWVVANAGSGKTYVLTSRIVRLLLAGARPDAILCLTFTKAAAAEMHARLSALLAGWATAPDAALDADLRQRLGQIPDETVRRAARTLFARVIDAPGALRIQTIHAFCESLLKRFPVEARVPPHFAVADEGVAAELMAQARNQLLADAMRDAALREALAVAVGRADERMFAEAIDHLLAGRRRLRSAIGPSGEGLEAAIAELWREFGVSPGDSAQLAVARCFESVDRAGFAAAAAALAAGGKTDGERALRLEAALAAPTPAEFYALWRRAFLTADGKQSARLATKAVQAASPAAFALLQEEQARIVALDASLNGIAAASASAALLRLGQALLQRYDRLKQARALLDYDDLILRAVALLQGAAPWVLYKLDGGIDHLLVDEAQDTAPEQWQAVAALVDEFFAGAGARETQPRRSVFVVGDEKQSIFSFQGADLAAFERMRSALAAKARAAWREVPLEVSFRSSQLVLDLVDRTFASPALAAGVVGAGKTVLHRAHRLGAAGHVELWPPLAPDEAADPVAWDAPLDYVSLEHPSVRLAARIARTVKGWIGTEILPALGRTVRAGDVLVLVRRRNRFFDACVRAFKDAGVPVAGADRMRLLDQIAIMDLLALARFCLLPGDDLALAELLKSPLYGFDDGELFALAHPRADTLWRALRARGPENPKWQAAADELSELLARADYVPPFEFYADLLQARSGRKRMLARLGPDAADPIDEFLAKCLAFERLSAPSLQGFVQWFQSGATDIKRDMEQGRDEVRVMTVHGAKGLEAEIVFLPDTCGVPTVKDKVLWRAHGAPLPLWPPAGVKGLAPVEAARDAANAAAMAEYRRLLYVAMTRARDRLYVCGWSSKPPSPDSWYAGIAAGFEALAQEHADAKDANAPRATRTEIDGLAVRAIATPQTGAVKARQAAVVADAAAPLPAWAQTRQSPREPQPPRPLVPSQPQTAPRVASPLAAKNRDAFLRGRLVHRLLQSLPDLAPPAREAAARRLLARSAYGLGAGEIDEIAAETLRVLADPAFAAAFAPGSLAEAPIVARIGSPASGWRALAGRIDRLAIAADRVLVVDFKTNRPPPAEAAAVDPVYLAQLAAYRAALRPLFPGRAIACALLWTYAPRLMAIDDALLDRHAPLA
jgi:ATP-dependent helicase/nuclease subunit A